MEISFTSKNIEFIPEWQENRADSNPIRATLKFLNTAQRTTLLPWDSDTEGHVRMKPDRRGLLLAGLEKLENCVMVDRDTGAKKEIKTAFELLGAYGLEGLAIEIATEIMSMNARGTEKNF